MADRLYQYFVPWIVRIAEFWRSAAVIAKRTASICRIEIIAVLISAKQSNFRTPLSRHKKHLRLTILFIALLIQSVYSDSAAQLLTHDNFIRYSREQGLSDNTVSRLATDDWGCLWIGTGIGLDVLDGANFKRINFERFFHLPPSHSGARPKTLFDNSLGILTDNGVYIVSPSRSSIRRLFVPKEKSIDFNFYSNSYIDVESTGNGSYGLSSHNGFYVFNAGGNLVDRYDKTKPGADKQLWYRFGKSIYQLPGGSLLQQNLDGFLIYDAQQKKIRRDSAYSTVVNYLYREGHKKKNSFIQLPNKNILLFHKQENAIVLINPGKNEFKSFKAGFEIKGSLDLTTSCFELNDSTFMVVSHRMGLPKLILHRGYGTAELEKDQRFNAVFCNDFFRDRNNCLWIATSDGLFKEQKNSGLINGILIPSPVFNKGSYFSILDMKRFGKNLFLATTSGILVFDPVSKQIIRALDLSSIDPACNHVTRLMLKDNDTIWAGTAKGLVWVHTGNFGFGRVKEAQSMPTLNEDQVSFLYTDSRRNVWIRTNRMLKMILYDHASRNFELVDRTARQLVNDDLYYAFVSSAAEDNDKNIWFGGDYLVRFNPRLNCFDSMIRYLPGKTVPIKSLNLIKDSGGRVWLAEINAGIYELNSTGIVQAPVMKHLEPFETEYHIPGSNKENVFFLYSGGICVMNKASEGHIIITRSDSIPPGPIFSGFEEDAGGKTSFFNKKNFLFWVSDSSLALRHQPPSLHITEFEILNDSLIAFPPSKLNLDRRQNNIRVSFRSVNFTDPDNMKFSYRVKNKTDSAWIDCTEDRSILLLNIAPGSYTLEIRAKAIDNKWPAQFVQLQINIDPPFWQTPLFIILVVVLALVLFYAIYTRRIKAVRQKANVDKQLAELEMKGLHSQMNPHFVFNSLNSIREMILNNENKDASHYLSKFAHLIRITLDHSGQAFVSLRETIEYLDRYIEMEQIRNPEFTYSRKMDETLDLDETVIPPMLVQPFIENALWHGVSPGNKDIHIRMEFKKEGNNLVCIIDDKGIGINQSVREKKESGVYHRPVGISNIRNRIALLNEKHNIRCSISVTDKSEMNRGAETGTLVVLELPLEIKDE